MTDPSSTLDARLQRLARFPLTTLPTPLEEYPRLAAAIGAERLLIKRDDLTGLAFGGNKVRELEYFLGAAKADGADVFVAGGGVGQSNHARSVAAAAAGRLDVHLVLRRGVFGSERVGNLLVTELLGAHIHWTEEDRGSLIGTSSSQRWGGSSATSRRLAAVHWLLTSSFHPLERRPTPWLPWSCATSSSNHDIGASDRCLHLHGGDPDRYRVDRGCCRSEWDVVAVGWRPG